MSELHWTGAALLLAIALSPTLSRAPRTTVATWSDFGREQGLAAAAPSVDAPPRSGPPPTAPTARPRVDLDAYQPLAATPSRATRLRAAGVCGHCGREAGRFEWNTAAPARSAIFRPADGGPPHVISGGPRLRCIHCGGPLFAEEPTPVAAPPPAVIEPVRRGRPRKPAARAS